MAVLSKGEEGKKRGFFLKPRLMERGKEKEKRGSFGLGQKRIVLTPTLPNRGSGGSWERWEGWEGEGQE